MSFHELTDTYPWLSKRVAVLQDSESKNGFPSYPFSARLVGLLCPGFLRGAFLPIIIVYVFFIFGLIAFPALIKKFQSKSTANISTTQTTTSTHWAHPISGKVLELPLGFSIYDMKTESDLIVGVFTTNADRSLEQLVLETATNEIEFTKYVDLLHQAKVKLLGNGVVMSQPVTRKVNGVEVAEFSFTTDSSG